MCLLPDSNAKSQPRSHKSAGNMGKTHQTHMQYAQFVVFGLGNARQALFMLVMQCRCYQHWYLQPQTQPTTRIWSVFLRLMALLRAQQPARASIMSIMGPIWATNFLLDTTHMRFQQPSKTSRMLKCPKVRNEGAIMLMMLARKKLPRTQYLGPKALLLVGSLDP